MRVNGGGELKTKSGTMVESIVNELIEQIQIFNFIEINVDM